MGAAVLILLGEAAAGFLILDLFFRFMAVEALARGAVWYGVMAGAVCGVALWGAWQVGGAPGLLLASPGPAVWWVLWRFGMRKQFTYLYKDDDGKPVHAEKPDP